MEFIIDLIHLSLLPKKTSILWVESSSKTNLSIDDLKKIISAHLKNEWKELIDLISDVTTKSNLVGYGMGEHRE